MKTFFASLRRLGRQPDFYPVHSRMHLTRSFVETGDERCPIAGIWSRLVETDTSADEELFWPAMRSLLSWRAFLPCPHAASLQ
jgi:hypothetical protein